MRYDFLNRSAPMNEQDLDDAEQAVAGEDTVVAAVARKALHDLREMRHETLNPNYMYAGGRIHRAAILCREATIEKLRKQIKMLGQTPEA